MHLLTAQAGAIEDGTEPVDLDQTPGDIVILTATDTEIAGLAAAQARLGARAPSLRLANLQTLRHNFSVDLYLEKTLARAKLVVLRLLGGWAYWPYGTDEVVRFARGEGIPLAVLPGCANPDPALDALSTLQPETCARLWTYLVEGGPANYTNLLVHCAHILGMSDAPPPPAPLPKAGLYAPGDERATLRDMLRDEGPVVALTFYRALVQAGDLAPVDALVEALRTRGLRPLPIFVSSLKDEAAGAIVSGLIEEADASVVLNATAFAASAPGRDWTGTPLEVSGAPVIQVAFSQSSREAWGSSPRGFGARDMAMHVSLPEVDGRLGGRAVSFKGLRGFDQGAQVPLLGHVPEPGRIAFAADLAAAWVRLRETPAAERRLAIVLNDGSAGDGRLGFAVGLDAPASVARALESCRAAGYAIEGAPGDGAGVIASLRAGEAWLPLADHEAFLARLPASLRDGVTKRWGRPQDDPRFDSSRGFPIRAARFGHAILAAQPPRAHDEDAARTAHHDPAVPPTHAYIAFHAWMRAQGLHALVHFGTHGSLEWLPGKATALSEGCWPEALLGALPVVYPFVVNDPGEAAQAKRRLAAVTIGHLTPPLADAETHGRVANLERLVDEYYDASGGDARRAAVLARDILMEAEGAGVSRDSGVDAADDETAALGKIDAFLCDLKRLQVRDGLHVFGAAPPADNAARLLSTLPADAKPDLDASPAAETAALLTALDGRFVRPGPAGAPTRGRADVLPTGRNLYSVDGRAVPTRAAWGLGRASAEELVLAYAQEHGAYPRRIAMSAWGTANMRTGGDDVAQALALMGARPTWDAVSHRVSGFEIVPCSELRRARVDVVFRVSGFFRDAFPAQMDLIESAARAIAALDEPADVNPLKDRFDGETLSPTVFGSAPQAYGAGLRQRIVQGDWETRGDLGEAFLAASGFAYGAGREGEDAHAALMASLAASDAVAHNQDHREGDILETTDFAEFEGGLAAAIESLRGQAVPVFHMDHADPAHPRARKLEAEIALVLRGRATSPRWIAAMRRHGHRGAQELAITATALLAFAATTDAVADHQFEALHEAYMVDADVRDWLGQANPDALAEIAARLDEAIRRGLWHPRRNSAADHVAALAHAPTQKEPAHV